MREDVHTLAEAYLKELHAEGRTGHRVIHSDRCKCEPAYIEDTLAFVRRVQEEHKNRRYEVKDLPTRYVLMSGKKYFYDFKGHEIMWTYDINLAHTEHAFTVEGLICLLESYDVEVTKLPAPEPKNRPSN